MAGIPAWRIQVAQRVLRNLRPEERNMAPEQFRENAMSIIQRIFPSLRYATRASYKSAVLGLVDPAPSSPAQEAAAPTPRPAAGHLEPLRTWVLRYQSHGRSTAVTALCTRIVEADLPPGALDRPLDADDLNRLADLDFIDEVLARRERLALGTRYNYAYAARKAILEARDGFLADQRRQREQEAEKRLSPAVGDCEQDAPAEPVKIGAGWREFPLERDNGSEQRASILLKIPEGGVRVAEVMSLFLALLQVATDYDPGTSQKLAVIPQI
jgi:hypothetical protein